MNDVIANQIADYTNKAKNCRMRAYGFIQRAVGYEDMGALDVAKSLREMAAKCNQEAADYTEMARRLTNELTSNA